MPCQHRERDAGRLIDLVFAIGLRLNASLALKQIGYLTYVMALSKRKLGESIGRWIEECYRTDWKLQGPLSTQQYAELVADFREEGIDLIIVAQVARQTD